MNFRTPVGRSNQCTHWETRGEHSSHFYWVRGDLRPAMSKCPIGIYKERCWWNLSSGKRSITFSSFHFYQFRHRMALSCCCPPFWCKCSGLRVRQNNNDVENCRQTSVTRHNVPKNNSLFYAVEWKDWTKSNFRATSCNVLQCQSRNLSQQTQSILVFDSSMW